MDAGVDAHRRRRLVVVLAATAAVAVLDQLTKALAREHLAGVGRIPVLGDAVGIGRVTDMLAYGDLFVGNVADVAIGVGLGVAGLSLWRRERSQTRDAARDEWTVAQRG